MEQEVLKRLMVLALVEAVEGATCPGGGGGGTAKKGRAVGEWAVEVKKSTPGVLHSMPSVWIVVELKLRRYGIWLTTICLAT